MQPSPAFTSIHLLEYSLHSRACSSGGKQLFCQILSASDSCSVLDRTTVCYCQNNSLVIDMTIQNADKYCYFQRFDGINGVRKWQKVNAGESKCMQHTPFKLLNNSLLSSKVKGWKPFSRRIIERKKWNAFWLQNYWHIENRGHKNHIWRPTFLGAM